MIFRNSRKIILANLFDFFLNFFYSFANLFNLKNISYPKTISNDPKKILLIEVFGLGDLFISFPAFKHLRNIFPAASIILVTLPEYSYAAKQFNIFDDILEYKAFWRKESRYRFSLKSLIKIIKKLRNENVDLAIDLRGDLRNILFLWLTRSKHRISYAISGGNALLTDIVPYDNSVTHQSIKNLAVIKYIEYQLNIKKDQEYSNMFNERSNTRKNSQLRIGIHPGAAMKEKMIDKQLIIAIIDCIKKIGLKPEIIIDPDSLKKYNELQDLYQDTILFTVTTDLKSLINRIKEMDLIICADSAVGHIAAFYNKNIISFFSMENPEKWKPISDKLEIFLINHSEIDFNRLKQIIIDLVEKNQNA